MDKTGRLAKAGNIIFSGNDTEIYTHEIVHIYTHTLFPNVSSFLDEGVAHTWPEAGNMTTDGIGIGLPGLLRSTRSLMLPNPSIPLSVCILKVKLPYPIGLALILERTKRIYGNVKLTEMLGSKSQIWDTLIGRANQ